MPQVKPETRVMIFPNFDGEKSRGQPLSCYYYCKHFIVTRSCCGEQAPLGLDRMPKCYVNTDL